MNTTKKLLLASCVAMSCASMAMAKTTLTVASFPDFSKAVEAAIPLYEKQHPEIEIKLVALAYGDHHNAMTTALATGANLPDVMGIEVEYMGRFAVSGGLENLSAAPYNAGRYAEQIIPFALPQAKSPEGQLVGIPADIGPGALFYREDIVKQAGLELADLTKSWESFIDAGKMIKEKTGNYMVASAYDIKDIYIRSNLKDGDGLYFDKDKNVQVNSPRFKEAFRLAKLARVAGIDANVSAWSPEWTEGLRRGTITTQMMGAWLAGHLNNWIAPDSKGKWRSSQLPEKTFASWGGSFYAIPEKAAHKKEAWDFIQFMTVDKSMQLTAFKALDAFPALISAQNDDFVNQEIEFLGNQKARQDWKVAAAKVPQISLNKYDQVARQVVNDALEKVLEKDVSIDQALADAEKLIKRKARR